MRRFAWSWLGLAITAFATTCSAQASGLAMPPLPPYLCRPCGETPPPPGYSCAGAVMVNGTVKTVDIPTIVERCAKTEPAKSATGATTGPSVPQTAMTPSPATAHSNGKRTHARHRVSAQDTKKERCNQVRGPGNRQRLSSAAYARRAPSMSIFAMPFKSQALPYQ